MMSLAETKNTSSIRLLQLLVARAFAAQLVLAVAYLHSRDIVHADLHPGNILGLLPRNMDPLSREQLYEKYGQPHHEPVICLEEARPHPDGVPANAVVPIWLGKASECVSLAEAHILVTDYGESFMPATIMRHHSNTPHTLIPPEIHFEPEESRQTSCAILEISSRLPCSKVARSPWIQDITGKYYFDHGRKYYLF
ncbi:uncharacterized protein BO66DRAFT_451167, partial [Aspergillus aculeatinus CBS 121060]